MYSANKHETTTHGRDKLCRFLSPPALIWERSSAPRFEYYHYYYNYHYYYYYYYSSSYCYYYYYYYYYYYHYYYYHCCVVHGRWS